MGESHKFFFQWVKSKKNTTVEVFSQNISIKHLPHVEEKTMTMLKKSEKISTNEKKKYNKIKVNIIYKRKVVVQNNGLVV